jgi:hypothetical protein
LNFVNKILLAAGFIDIFQGLCAHADRRPSCGVQPSHLVGSGLIAFMAAKPPQIERLGAVLDQSLKRLDLGARLDEYGVWPIWNDIVGVTVAKNAQPQKIRKGTLFIKVSSPVWMQQLQYMKEMIADKLNHRLGSAIVKNIFFIVGRIDPMPVEIEAAPAALPAGQAPPREVDAEFLKTIADDEIRQAFERLLKTYARRKEKR